MNDKKKLGKGLDALLSSGSSQMMASLLGGRPRETAPSPAHDDGSTSDRDGSMKNIPVDLIQRGKYQPRTDMHEEALEELSASIKTQGVMQPIVIRPISSDKYEIIAGERRWRATQMAGLDTIPAIVKPVGDEAAIAMALIENIQRENLNPIEEAMALKRLQDEFELTQQEVADAVGKSRVTVTNLMRLIGLHIDVRKMLEHGDMEMGHARALLALPYERQPSAARVVSGKGLSVRQTEALVRRFIANKGTNRRKQHPDPDIKSLEETLAEKLGTKVMIQQSARGKGTLAIKYSSLDELDGILAHIK